jgi:hypothetical protein
LRALASLGLAALLAACSPGTPQAASSAPPSGSTVATATPPSQAGPRPLRGEPPGGSPRRGDPRWQRALAGDPLDVAALAQAEGATGLLEGVEDGGELMRVALAALPLAADAELALGRLGELALLDDAAVAEPALEAIHLAAGAPPSRGEPLDPDGVLAAARAVMTIAANATLPRERRARAVSAARAFAERGVLDPARIPADLDPAPAPGEPPWTR